MSGAKLQEFMTEVYDLACRRCGQEFADRITYLRRERERLLKNSWKEVAPDDISSTVKQEIFRAIDFDTIIAHAAKILEVGEYTQLVFEIAETSVRFGEFEKAQRLLDLLSTQYKETAGDHLIAKTFQKLGDIAFYKSAFDAAISAYQTSAQYYQQSGNAEGLVAIRNSEGVVRVEMGTPDQGEALFLQAREQARAGHYTSLLVNINMNLGNVYNLLGAYEKAMDSYQEALGFIQGQGREVIRARILHNIGIVYKSQNKNSEALQSLEDSIQLAVGGKDLYLKGLSYIEKAEVLSREGDLAAGTALATTAFQIFSEVGDRLSMADVYKVFGMISGKRNQYDLALSYLENSLRINQDYHNSLNVGETLYELAVLYAEKGETEQAFERGKLARDYFNQVKAQKKVEAVDKLLATMT